MNDSLISIIIPVYNSEKYITRCLESLMKQTHKNLEIIIVDDGSTDNSFQICNSIGKKDTRIKIYRKINEGQGIARNYGLKYCTGKFISFVDSDDWVDRDIYKKMLDLMIEYDSDIVEVGSYEVNNYKYIVDRQNPNIKVVEGQKNILYDYLYNGMRYSTAGYPVWNKLYRKECFFNVEFSSISRHEDYLINFQILKNIQKIIITSEKLYYYYQHNESTTKGILESNDLLMIDNCKKVYQESLMTKDSRIIKLAKTKVSRCYFSCLCKALIYGASSEITDDIVQNLFEKVENSFLLLLSSPMNYSRKVVLLLLVVYKYFPLKKIKYISKCEGKYENKNQ